MHRIFNKKLNTPTQGFLACVFLLSLWLAGLYGFTRNVGETAGHAANPADAIVVLTGGSNRLQTGFDLLEKGFGKKIFISGVYQGVDVRTLLSLWKDDGTEDMREAVTLGFDADDTIGNARETTQWMETQGFSSLYLVTANYHLKRAMLEFEITAPALIVLPYPVAPEGLDMTNWWRNRTHRALIIKEYMKYLATLVRYAVTK